jgi:hypothetical protein
MTARALHAPWHMRFAAAVLVVMGCTRSPLEAPAPVASFSKLFMGLLATEGSFKILLDVGEPQPKHCAVLLDDAAARLGTLEVPLVERGIWTGEDEEGTTQCHFPLFAAYAPAPEAASTFEIRDRSGAMQCSVPGFRLIPQNVAAPGGPWQVRAGQAITMTWPPSSGHRLCTVALASAGPSPSTVLSYEDLGDGVMRFTVPSVVPGNYTLDLLLFGIPMTCSGANLASPVTATFSFQQSITIVP